MEDFSQSRGDDDLFDDEIIPFDNPPSPEKVTARLEQVSLEPSSASTPIPDPPVGAESSPASEPSPVKPATPTEHPLPGSKSRQRGRGVHGTGQGEAGRKIATGLEDSKWAVKGADAGPPGRDSKSTRPPASRGQQISETSTIPSEPIPQPHGEDSTTSASTVAPSSIPTGPSNTAIRTPAVRGDRLSTGGIRPPKLSDEELTAKLAAAKERSQSLAAAHARAQADAANFEERERQARERRERDIKDRRVMEGERERNRLRKMAGQLGREWDRDKDEQQVNGRGGRRGYSGPPPGEEDDLKMYEWHEDRGRGRGRGRGGRGGAGRGRGRGGPRRSGFGHNGDGHAHQLQPDWSVESDFPSLPGSNTSVKKEPGVDMNTTPNPTAPKPSTRRWDSAGGQASGSGSDSGSGLAGGGGGGGGGGSGGGGTWAEQVESSELNAENENKPRNFW
ncbi:uncharacterized protein Z519_00299 [Cladophialophora bantiana CBS 173.52]|uniref:Uncharacterized protein n=1 Tax=Cladophialophora bantiana (strain ATCC 10958 / CBS 173.52 / CDC B-1940 / NIH 8579) TaxID=1442370 RepID=A0A0D2HYU7_CLAB1|nr:uncharacterized protein Z519_00299 [Cladophialophora bantiana CBS 173.52]KIW98638.1 hypothetical protein Z519_00299 [Cladophialophora bantiana CBS 173.52]